MTQDTPPGPVLCLMGPTASGKTALAIDLVQQLPVDIISVDSAQVYRGMDIGTGKPDAETLKRAPHRLIDILDPADAYSAARFCDDAWREIADIQAAGRIPLLVGGTMLYFRALRDGLSSLPEADPEIRQQITELAEREGWAAVHRQLADVDPLAAARIHPNDPQRLQRALEVFLVTGRSMSTLQSMSALQSAARPGFSADNLLFMALQPSSRQLLHQRIEQRFHEMLDAGLVDEVQRLYDRGDLNLRMPSIRSVGYRQVWQHLDGEISFDAMVERGIIATRQLAKRQVTWLRSWHGLHNFVSDSSDSLDRVLKLIRAVSM